jgi:sulfite exporter TauE/SafE
MEVPLELFLTGLALGSGPCMLFCLPILIPFVAGTRDGWVEGLWATLAFSVSRLSAYTLLGLVAGLVGEVLVGLVGGPAFSFAMISLGGLLIAMLGTLIVFQGSPRAGVFGLLFRAALGNGLRSPFLLGFIVGIKPCAPLLGILTYIALNVRTPLIGAYYAFVFGLGASVITPITALGIAAGGLPRVIFKSPRVFDAFKKACGAMLILLGAKQVLEQLTGASLWM